MLRPQWSDGGRNDDDEMTSERRRNRGVRTVIRMTAVTRAGRQRRRATSGTWRQGDDVTTAESRWRTGWRRWDDVWTTTTRRRRDGRQDDGSNRKQKRYGAAWRQKRDVRMATTTVTMTRNGKDGDDDDDARRQDDDVRSATVGRRPRQQQVRHDRPLTTTVAGTAQKDDVDGSMTVTTGQWRWRRQQALASGCQKSGCDFSSTRQSTGLPHTPEIRTLQYLTVYCETFYSPRRCE